MMDFGNEEVTANYFITGLAATIASNGLDALTALVEVKKRLDEEINKALEHWADKLRNEENNE
jgi:polyphosphate kinase